MQTYHASETYSREIQRLLIGENVSFDCANTFALLEVADELGHNIHEQLDVGVALEAISEKLIDPIVRAAIRKNAEEAGLGYGASTLRQPMYEKIHHVSSVQTGHTPGEREFSNWLHTVPVHNYIESEPQGLPIAQAA